MSSIVRFAKTLRNNWKKSTFAAVLIAYGIDYAKSKYQILQMMRVYCEEAKTFGDLSIGNITKPRHLTVIMNPSAKNGKGVALYEKYAVPLLHLAGIRVSLIKTEYEGQAKALMEVMDNTDAVLVAGGDGTLLEVVTGLCKRDDANSAITRFPVGIIPIGRTNTVAKYLFGEDSKNECRLLAETAMAVIKGNMKQIDVMSISSDDGKQVFALASLEWGRFRDVKVKIPKYWYWGYLKSQVAYVFSAFKTQADPMEANLSYTLPCEGCSKCYESKTKIIKREAEEKVESRRWWHAFIPKQNRHSPVSPNKDFSTVINNLCGVWHEKEIKTVDLCIETSNNRLQTQSTKPMLTINVGPEEMGKFEFIGKGWWIDHSNYSESKSLNLKSEVLYANEIKLNTNFPQDSENWYSIDNENFEAKPIQIQLIPKKINVYVK